MLVKTSTHAIIDIINDNNNNTELSYDNFRSHLLELYSNLFKNPKFKHNIAKYFIKEKKLLNIIYQKTGDEDRIQNYNNDIDKTVGYILNRIKNEKNYILTEIDIYILMYFHKVPIIIASGSFKTRLNGINKLLIDLSQDSKTVYILITHKIKWAFKEILPGMGGWYALKIGKSLKFDKKYILNNKSLKNVNDIQSSLISYNKIMEEFNNNTYKNDKNYTVRDVLNDIEDDIQKNQR